MNRYNKEKNSKNNTSYENLEKNKLTFPNPRFDYNIIPRKKKFSLKKREVKSKTKYFRKLKTSLYDIYQQKKVGKIKNIFIAKPKLTMRQIKQIISKKFYSQYKKHYINIKSLSTNPGNELPTIYGYYQINNLLEKKNCKIKIFYDEFQLYVNISENLFEFFNSFKSHTLLKFLITFFYRNHLYNDYISMKEKYNFKIMDFINFVKIGINLGYAFTEKQNSIMFGVVNNVIKICKETNNKKIDDINNINEIMIFIKENKVFECGNIDELNYGLNDYVKYLPLLLNIPLINFKSIFPHCFRCGYDINFYIRKYISKRLKESRMNNIIKIIILDKEEITEKANELIISKKDKKNYKPFFNESLLHSQCKLSKKKEITEEALNNNNKSLLNYMKENKIKKCKENTRAIDCEHIFDIQNLVKNINLVQGRNKKFGMNQNEGFTKIKNYNSYVKKINENKNVKGSTSFKVKNFTRNSNNKIVLKKSKKRNKNNSINGNVKFITKKNSIDAKYRTINSTFQRNHYNNFSEKDNTIKVITQYNNKDNTYKNKNKNSINYLSETKNSCIYKYLKGKSAYNNSLISTVASSENNNYLQNKREKKLKIYKFKDAKKFWVWGLKHNNKFALKKILLKNISNFNIDLYMQHYYEENKNKFKYNKNKTYDIEEKELNKEVFVENPIKIKYNFKLLMHKVQNFRNKKVNSQKILDRNINTINISKLGNIYDD